MVLGPSRILARPAIAPLHEVFGLACGVSLVPAMARAHRHDDVELVLPLGGTAVLEHAGARHELADGRAPCSGQDSPTGWPTTTTAWPSPG